MHLEKYQSNGKEYLRLVRTIRIKRRRREGTESEEEVCEGFGAYVSI